MSLVEKHENIIVLSDPDTGAIDITLKGSHFAVSFNTPIQIPKQAVNCTVSVESANVWFVTPNVIEGKNKLYLKSLTREVFEKELEFKPGLYDVSLFRQTFIQQMESYADKITLSADNATNKITFTFVDNNYKICFKDDSPCEMLGFPVGEYGADYEAEPDPEDPIEFPHTIYAPNKASFNTLEYFLIHSTIVDGRGININNVTNSTIAKVEIDAKAGRQVLYRPVNPIHVGATHLSGSSLRRVEFWITDQKGEPLDCFEEFWGCTLVIKYQEPFVIQNRN